MSSSDIQEQPTRADFLVKTLNLSYLPKESGYIGILGRSPHNVKPTNDTKLLAAQSYNYYMLTSEFPINYLHLLVPDDNHIIIEGGPVEYYTFSPTSEVERVILGRDYLAGQTPIISVPGGSWKALRLCEGVEYALMANVLAPEFTEDRVTIGAGKKFIETYRGKADWATEEFLKLLIGDNWIQEA